MTEGELAELLTQIEADEAEVWGSIAERERLARLLTRYQEGNRGKIWLGCACREDPWHLRLGGRARMGYSELGNPWDQEGGLTWGPGWNLNAEPVLDLVRGSWWFSGTVRGQGPLFRGSVQVAPALAWPGWPLPSGKTLVAESRLGRGEWFVTVPRALLGVSWGNWSLSAGWSPRRSGPGLTGALVLDQTAPSFPALTVRRIHPFVWRGFMRPLAPADLMLRVGVLSSQQVTFRDDWGLQSRQARPWFMQWLASWRITSWFRTTVTHGVMATAMEGTLWPDLLQINFPLKGATWRETDSGPVTDRVFSAQFEIRWRQAPWPLLPKAAGRIYWDYAGTDYAPSGPGGWIPEIAAPASVVGVELLSPRWDLAAEFAELEHPNILWYSNGGFSAGYSQDGWVLGHALGGTGSAITGLVRLRPDRWPLELEIKAFRADWGSKNLTPGTGRQLGLGLTLRRLLVAVPWEVTGEWMSEEADPDAFEASFGDAARRHWLRVSCKLEL